jgi:hypothetical protein
MATLSTAKAASNGSKGELQLQKELPMEFMDLCHCSSSATVDSGSKAPRILSLGV